MPNDDLDNADDVVDSSSSRPESRQRQKGLEFANDFIRGWLRITDICEL
jgi:hypothetical protein